MTYEIDGEQYVALMVGTGSSWAMIGGDANMKGFVPQNLSRLLVYKLGGNVQLPAAPAKLVPPIAPPPNTAPAAEVARGAPLYDTYCSSCHGAGVIGVGILPDLRRTPLLATAEAFEQVVIGGARQHNGMANFSSELKKEDVEAIRAFVILRANQDKPAAAR
jgi:alcohol dehydrogenase (cytochrome c)/quinohemoprotein ethanol dehydrogenase